MPLSRDQMAGRAAQEIRSGQVVNLGIGMPTLVSNHVPPGVAWVHSENGILGVGPYPDESDVDPDVINASKEPVTVLPGGSFFDSSVSFAMIRTGRIDLTLLGGMQVSQVGDLANWMAPGQFVPGMGGAMDLAQGTRRLVVLMNHRDAHGASKLVERCTLPLTVTRKVERIITDLGVIDVTQAGLRLFEIAPDVSVEEVRNTTDAELLIPDDVPSVRV